MIKRAAFQNYQDREKKYLWDKEAHLEKWKGICVDSSKIN